MGKTPAEFSIAPRPLQRVAVGIPAGLPSSLLERRPDIAAAERAMAAAHARLGAAPPAFFPRLHLPGPSRSDSPPPRHFFHRPPPPFLLAPPRSTLPPLPPLPRRPP